MWLIILGISVLKERLHFCVVVIATAQPVPDGHRVNRLGLVGCCILGFLQAHYQITDSQDLDMDDVLCDYNHLLQTASVHVSG